MTTEVDSKPVAIVTGGGTGIGSATAVQLVQAGWDVAICGRRPHLLAETAAATGAFPIAVDMSDEDGAGQLVNSVTEKFGRVDGLVLNAAVAHAGRFMDTTDALWRDMLETNLLGAARLTRAVLPYFDSNGGSIVGVASLAALRASSFMSGYAASKAGLGLMLQSVAVEFGHKGVRANLVCPGLIKTQMSATALMTVAERRNITLEAAYQTATQHVPARRAGDPSEIASVIAFLLSDGASYLTGAIIPIDGGASAVDVAALLYENDH